MERPRYSDPGDEWQVTIRCDGKPVAFPVRRRFGEHEHNNFAERIETFQLFRENQIAAVFVLPRGPVRRAAAEVALRTLAKTLGASTAVVDADDDAVETLF